MAISPVPPATDIQEIRSCWRRMAGAEVACESHFYVCFDGQQNQNSDLAECLISFCCTFFLKEK